MYVCMYLLREKTQNIRTIIIIFNLQEYKYKDQVFKGAVIYTIY